MTEGSLDPRVVREELIREATTSFPNWEARGQYKDPELMLSSFSERLEKSTGLDKLLRCDAIPGDDLNTILRWLVSFYDDPRIEAAVPPDALEWVQHFQSLARDLRRKGKVLAQAAEILRVDREDPEAAAVNETHARLLEQDAEEAQAWVREWKKLSRLKVAPGNPIVRGPGPQRNPSSAFVEYAERRLQSLVESQVLKTAEVHRLVAELAADFWDDAMPWKLRERQHAAARRAKRNARLTEPGSTTSD